MATSWTTMDEKAGGGANEGRRAVPPPREWIGEPPSTADILAERSPKISDCILQNISISQRVDKGGQLFVLYLAGGY